MGKTYVLLHGAWHGGWCWRHTAAALRARGHQVLTPTQTGLGERRHLLSAGITLETFINDLTGLLEAEELEDVVLVGHSFGGLAISGAADRMPQRIRHLVYLDAMVLQPGESPFGVLPDAVVAKRRALVAEQGGGLFIPTPPVSAFGVAEDHPLAPWLRRRLTPHPAGTYQSALPLHNPVGNGLPRSYIACTAPDYAPLAAIRGWVRQQPDWQWLELATGHDAMVTAPEALAAMLDGIGQA
jgi:pimeloyl-ACP methyl ester carboxylesterase